MIFKEDIYIPSISLSIDNKQEVKYTKVSKELANEAIEKGYM
jgi:hypothetical protein